MASECLPHLAFGIGGAVGNVVRRTIGQPDNIGLPELRCGLDAQSQLHEAIDRFPLRSSVSRNNFVGRNSFRLSGQKAAGVTSSLKFPPDF